MLIDAHNKHPRFRFASERFWPFSGSGSARGHGGGLENYIDLDFNPSELLLIMQSKSSVSTDSIRSRARGVAMLQATPSRPLGHRLRRFDVISVDYSHAMVSACTQRHHNRQRISPCKATGGSGPSPLAPGSVSVILLAGGVGKRMGASIPKQYLKLRGQEIATYSLKTFARMPEVKINRPSHT